MASNLRVDNIQPSTAMGIGIGTANGSVTFNADVTGGLNVTNGSVGIGTDTPTQDLEIQDDTLPTVIVRNRTSSSYARVLLNEVGDAGGSFTINRLGSTSSAYGGARAAQIWNHANAPIVFGTNNTEAARFNTSGNLAFPSGNGIDFSAASPSAAGSSSAVLDDYEEGTFVPNFSASGVTFTYDAAYHSGHYTKIGNLVHIQFYLGITALSGTTSSSVTITGLPFTGISGEQGIASLSSGSLYNIDWPATAKSLRTTLSGGTNISLQWNQDDGPTVAVTAAEIGSSGYISIAGTYIVV